MPRWKRIGFIQDSAASFSSIFLKGDAYEYWCSLDEDIQTDWEKLKEAFKDKIGPSKSVSAVQRMHVKNQLMSLKQGSRHISEYIKDMQSLSLKVPKELDELLAMAFIAGMSDQSKKERVSFAITGEAEQAGGLKFTNTLLSRYYSSHNG